MRARWKFSKEWLVLLVPLAAYLLLLAYAGWSLHRARAALIAAGRPMRLEEVVPAPVPDADNAAPLYLEAIRVVQTASPVGDRRWHHSLREEITPFARMLLNERYPLRAESQAELDRALDSQALAKAVVLLEQGNTKAHCVFPVDWSRGMDANLAHLDGLRDLSMALAAKAVREARRGNGPEAWKLLVTGLRLADKVKAQPGLRSQYRRTTMVDRIFLPGLALAQEYARPDSTSTAELTAALNALEKTDTTLFTIDSERLVIGEFAFSPAQRHRMIENIKVRDRREFFIHAFYGMPFGLPLRQLDHAAYLRHMAAWARDAVTPYSAGDAPAPTDPPRYQQITGELPSLGPCKARRTELVAGVRLAACGLALFAVQAKEGAFPADLSGLAAAGVNTTDPFTGKPFHYRCTDTGFVIFSVGQDLRDNGGEVRPAVRPANGVSYNPQDIVWSYVPQPSP